MWRGAGGAVGNHGKGAVLCLARSYEVREMSRQVLRRGRDEGV